MYTQVHRLSDFIYKGRSFKSLYVIIDREGVPPIIPLMYAAYLCQFGVVYESKEITDELTGKRFRYLAEQKILDATVRAYIYSLSKFLQHLDSKSSKSGSPGPHASSSCSERSVNDYLNVVLADELESEKSLTMHHAALSAYFTWLDYMEISPRLNLKISRATRQRMAEKNGPENYIQYVTKHNRLALLNVCRTLCEKLIIRMGYEVGLRTSEVSGLRVEGKGKLLQLLENFDKPASKHFEQFPYFLEGRYTKGGKSRWIYFSRDLLRDMKRYFDTERKWLATSDFKCNGGFFLRNDNRFRGTPISTEHASRVFRRRLLEAHINPLLHFHDLRHTFATELFHAEIAGKSGRETRSESAALIVVAQRLGHSFTESGQAPAATTCYIRFRLQMLELEGLKD